MTSFIDPEFGEVVVHRRRGSRSVRIRIGTDGRYTATTPTLTPLFYVKQVINASRDELRNLASNTSHAAPYVAGQQIGKTHTLAVVTTGMVNEPNVKVERKTLIVYLRQKDSLTNPSVQQLIRDATASILRKEAKSYLPKRLKAIATEHGLRYERVRFGHASGRWGSCSSTGTISLNIALMKLPDQLIDYVLCHELAHTRQMNHSAAFWRELAALDPLYKLHRQQIKHETPSV